MRSYAISCTKSFGLCSDENYVAERGERQCFRTGFGLRGPHNLTRLHGLDIQFGKGIGRGALWNAPSAHTDVRQGYGSNRSAPASRQIFFTVFFGLSSPNTKFISWRLFFHKKGRVWCRERLGGLLKYYDREAA